MTINYDLCPEHSRNSLQRYIENGKDPGSFLLAVLSNDLFAAMGFADDINRYQIFDICKFLYNEAPGQSWGNGGLVTKWIEVGGLRGIETKEKETEESE